MMSDDRPVLCGGCGKWFPLSQRADISARPENERYGYVCSPECERVEMDIRKDIRRKAAIRQARENAEMDRRISDPIRVAHFREHLEAIIEKFQPREGE